MIWIGGAQSKILPRGTNRGSWHSSTDYRKSFFLASHWASLIVAQHKLTSASHHHNLHSNAISWWLLSTRHQTVFITRHNYFFLTLTFLFVRLRCKITQSNGTNFKPLALSIQTYKMRDMNNHTSTLQALHVDFNV